MLRSADFIFRPLVADDASGFVDAVRESAASIAPWMPWASTQYALHEAQSWIDYCQRGWQERSSFEFGIFDAVSGALAGNCGLNQFNHLHGYCNLGYWVRQSHQRRGAATQAIRTLSEFGFADLPIGRIEIVVGVGNDASLGAARKAGALEEGIARNRLKLGERFIDGHLLSLIAPSHA